MANLAASRVSWHARRRPHTTLTTRDGHTAQSPLWLIGRTHGERVPTGRQEQRQNRPLHHLNREQRRNRRLIGARSTPRGARGSRMTSEGRRCRASSTTAGGRRPGLLGTMASSAWLSTETAGARQQEKRMAARWPCWRQPEILRWRRSSAGGRAAPLLVCNGGRGRRHGVEEGAATGRRTGGARARGFCSRWSSSMAAGRRRWRWPELRRRGRAERGEATRGAGGAALGQTAAMALGRGASQGRRGGAGRGAAGLAREGRASQRPCLLAAVVDPQRVCSVRGVRVWSGWAFWAWPVGSFFFLCKI